MAKEFPEFTETKAFAAHGAANSCDFVEGIGQSMKSLDVVIRELARSEVPVLLMAESGTGKKATAERIHQMSAHREEPFRVISCADVTESMLDKGADGIGGVFESGTVYFEELADLSSACQETLLSGLRAAEGNGNGHASGRG
jgi:two-component system response regulator HydG